MKHIEYGMEGMKMTSIKPLLTFLLCCLALVGKGQYHIAVVKESSYVYHVEFTNNDWHTKDAIKAYEPIFHNYDVQVFGSESAYLDAVTFAKKFKTYADCLLYNKKQHDIYIHDNPKTPNKTIIY